MGGAFHLDWNPGGPYIHGTNGAYWLYYPGRWITAPSAGTTLTPSSVPITPNATNWSPLGTSSGQCWAAGCGNTGWVLSNYTIASAGNYYLEVGVVNWADQNYDSGLALDGITVGGVPVGPTSGTPERVRLCCSAADWRL